MIKINDYATKNHFNNWEIKDLPDNKGEWKPDHKGKLFFWGNNVWGYYRLDLPNGDLSILFYLADIQQLNRSIFFIPSLPDNKTIIDKIDNLFYTGFGRAVCPRIYALDNSSCTETGVVQNITPDWSKYIAKDNAVLFLSEEDGRRYGRAMGLNWFYCFNKDSINSQFIAKNSVSNNIDNEEAKLLKEYYNLPKALPSKKISIIIPSIHSKNIQEISNIAKNLKENYGVEYVEVIATHCYLSIFYDKTPHVPLYSLQYHLANYECEDDVECINYIDKIITTDSTGVLEVQDTDKLKVVDCEDFDNN